MRKSANSTSLLVDRNGRPLAATTSTQRYASTSWKLNNRSYTDGRSFGQNRNSYTFLNPSERLVINQFALDLFRSSPVIHSAITKKNDWVAATAWVPQYKGTNVNWGNQAKEYLKNVVYPNCSVSGNNMTFNRLLVNIANQIDIAGDVLTVLTIGKDGIPRIAIYPSGMVGQRNINGTVESGRYVGATIDDGVIMNRLGTPIAYHILQDSAAEDYDLSARDAQLVFEPSELTTRGISILAPSLLTYLSVDDISNALNRMVFNESKTGLIVSTDTGTGDDYQSSDPMAADVVTAPASAEFQPSVIDLGDVTFVNAKSGEKVESLKSDRPHSNAQEWIRYLSETVCYDLGWMLPLISPEKLTGANAKMIESQIQQTISVRQQTLKRVASLYTNWAISKAMESGDLPKISSNDWRLWDWSMPAEFVINSTDQDDIAGWSAGTKTLQEIAARNAGDWQETRQQRETELDDACQRAMRLVAKYPSLSFERCLSLVGVASTQVSPKSEQTISTNNGSKP